MALTRRFATIIEEDHATDGFWEEVARHYGVADSSDLTDEQREYAERCCVTAARKLFR